MEFFNEDENFEDLVVTQEILDADFHGKTRYCLEKGDSIEINQREFAELYKSSSEMGNVREMTLHRQDSSKENLQQNDLYAFFSRTKFLSEGFDDLIKTLTADSCELLNDFARTSVDSFSPEDQLDGETPKTYHHPESLEYDELLANTADRILKVAKICGVTVSLFAMSRLLRIRCLAFTDYRPKWMLLMHAFLRTLSKKERKPFLVQSTFEKDMTQVLKKEVFDLTTTFFGDAQSSKGQEQPEELPSHVKTGQKRCSSFNENACINKKGRSE